MTDRKIAVAAVEKAAATLQAMSYDELKQLCRDIAAHPEKSIWEEQIENERVQLGIMISEFNALQKRICVELKAIDFVKSRCLVVPGSYFERFKNGRLWIARNGSAYMLTISLIAIGLLLAIFAITLWLML